MIHPCCAESASKSQPTNQPTFCVVSEFHFLTLIDFRIAVAPRSKVVTVFCVGLTNAVATRKRCHSASTTSWWI